MSEFILDARLVNDCFLLGRLDFCHLLLMDNASLPWFILVPETTETELYALSEHDQVRLLQEINLVSGYVKGNFSVSKLNVAAIGNIVSQMHVHIVGRHPADYCWPNVVWGIRSGQRYTAGQVKDLVASLRGQLGDWFVAS